LFFASVGEKGGHQVQRIRHLVTITIQHVATIRKGAGIPALKLARVSVTSHRRIVSTAVAAETIFRTIIN
jgi:hypothetical protein